MARRVLRPVSVDGIEFDALIDEDKTMSSTVPVYPVEDGFPVSDTIILEPLSISMNLYVSNTPVTWLQQHGSSTERVNIICEQIENMWLEKKLVKVITTEAIYTDMGITSINIKKSKEIGYAREIAITMQKVRKTEKRTASIPSYLLQSGKTGANAGSASTSTTSTKSGESSASDSGTDGSNSTQAKKGQSILYGVASGLGFI